MAENTRVFQIKINGLTESVDAVKSLKKELKECESVIKNLQNANIKIKVSGVDEVSSSKTKVSSSKTSTTTEDKTALEIEKEKTKQIELQNEALREQLIQKEQLKQANKETLSDIQQEAKGYSTITDGVKEYANTLNGMSAELKDIKAELRNTDIDSDGFKELTEKAANLNDKLKSAEEAYGQFGRNVGNYTQSILDALDSWDGKSLDFNIAGAEGSLNDLKAQLAELKNYWANLSPDDANFQKTAEAIKSVNNQIQDMESSLNDVGQEANSAFTGRFTTTIGGVEASFTNASEACEALRKKLVAMRVAGEENSPMYQEIINLVRRLSKEVQVANKQVEGMTKVTQNLNKVVGVMKGLSGLASLGQGIAGIFGGQSENLDKLIQKFASLTLVASGISQLEEELNKGTSAFSKFANAANSGLEKILSPLNSIVNATSVIKEYSNTIKEIESIPLQYQDNINQWLLLYQQIKEATQSSEEFETVSKRIMSVFNDWGNPDNLDKFNEAVNDLKSKFPELNSQIDEFVERTKTAISIDQDTQEALEKYNELINEMSPLTKKIANALVSLGKGGQIAAAGLKAIAVSLKTLGKATIVLAVLQLLAETIDLITSSVGKAWDAMKGWFGIMSKSEAKKLSNDLDNVSKQLDALNKELEIKVSIGDMGNVESELAKLKAQLQSIADIKITIDANEKMLEWMNEMQSELDKTDSSWKDLTKTEQEAATAMEAISKIKPSFFEALKDKSPREQLAAIDEELRNVGTSVDELNSLKTILEQNDESIEDFLDKLSDIDSDLNDIGVDGAKAFGKFNAALMEARSKAASVISQIRSDLSSLTRREYSLRLSLDATDFNSRIELVKLEMEELAKNYGMTVGSNGKVSKKNGGQMNAEEKEVAERIERINALETKAAKKANADAVKQRQQQQKSEAESRKREAESRKREAEQAAKEARQRANNEANARIEAMQDGIDKELKMLEQKRKEELQNAKETGKSVATINALYDKQVLEVKKKYAEYIQNTIKDANQRIIQMEQEFFNNWKEMQRQIEDMQAETDKTKSNTQQTTKTREATFDNTLKGSERYDAEKEYYEKLLQIQKNYISQQENLSIQASQREIQRLIEDENQRYEQQTKAYENEIEEYKKSIQEKIDAGQITEQEGNDAINKVTEQSHKHQQEELEQHNKMIQSITEKGDADIDSIIEKNLADRQAATNDALTKAKDSIQDFYNKIDDIMEKSQKKNTKGGGFISFGNYKQSIKDAMDEVEKCKQKIEELRAELEENYQSGEIDFSSYQAASQSLDDLANEAKEKGDDLKDKLDGSFNAWLKSQMDYCMQYVDQISSIWDTIDEMYTRDLDAQEDALDKKKELLEEELEAIEEAMEKQEEITQEHSDNISEIEDELSTARGDRREALIDQLAQERTAQEASIAEENRLTNEKKKNAKKQEQIEKQQDALEKKRKQQEKRSSIVQATINTYTAVSNALAVHPWYVGLALSGVALGLGMANVAQIAAQQYADGGLLNGKSHKQGGMRIQGTNIEVEGGEMVVNKQSTNANLPLLEYINSHRRTLTREDLVKFYDNGNTTLINRNIKTKFEEGGQLPQISVNVRDLMRETENANQPTQSVVSVVDIINAMENVNQVRVLAGDFES